MSKFANFVLLCVSQCIMSTCADILNKDDLFSTQREYPEAYCQPYCNSGGYLIPGQTCIPNGRPIFCCGTEYERECCEDPDQDVGDMYPPENQCGASSWWYYHGDINHTRQRAVNLFGRSRSEQGTGTGSGETTTSENNDNPMENFDPCSPNAFSPPAYESLPKEPPKYGDIFGEDNVAFENDAETSFANENPPDYAIDNETTNRTNETHSASPGEATGGNLTPVENLDSDSMIEVPLNEETTHVNTDDVISSAL
ncbi:hypothetical protein CAPTEDRAFT_207026 [Capitella teleta]|uniref:Shisa N-terminal domain-containing protein n=1 Tax=Capitella teleta TaxID=283909 RepID=R7US29_CAPTE|nr:hypothetical protein CAPTEDRAFT_207026 [Capitella teleta]|eukprot:ELU08948.1 hypothetical protein CAPTEDRAFT_207026 [Capitella teleta]